MDKAQLIRWISKRRKVLSGGSLLALFLLIAFFGPYLAPMDPGKMNLDIKLEGPSQAHLLGTDEFGRDLLSRMLFGARYTLGVGIGSVMLGLVLGVSIGVTAGYFGGWVDVVAMRLIDVLLAFPGFLLALAIVAALGPGLVNLGIAVGTFSIPVFARVARGGVLSVKDSEYVEAARSLGAGNAWIIWHHVLPNILAPLFVVGTLRLATAILTASGLSFLGMGAPTGIPEWGAILSTGKNYLALAPHLVLVPGAAIFLVVLGFNILGDGLRDVLDPRLK